MGQVQPQHMTTSKPQSTHAHSGSANPVLSVRNFSSEPDEIPAQDDFYLLDVMGGANVSVMHPTKPVVAYTTGKYHLFLRYSLS